MVGPTPLEDVDGRESARERHSLPGVGLSYWYLMPRGHALLSQGAKTFQATEKAFPARSAFDGRPRCPRSQAETAREQVKVKYHKSLKCENRKQEYNPQNNRRTWREPTSKALCKLQEISPSFPTRTLTTRAIAVS